MLPPVATPVPARPDVILAQAMASRRHPRPDFAQTAPPYPHHSPTNFSVVVNAPHQQTGDVGLMLLIESRKKSGWLAAFLNLVFPGAGYMYCGRPLLGVVVFLFMGAVFVFTLGLLAWVFMPILFIDGFLCAGRHNRELVEEVLRERASTQAR